MSHSSTCSLVTSSVRYAVDTPADFFPIALAVMGRSASLVSLPQSNEGESDDVPALHRSNNDRNDETEQPLMFRIDETEEYVGVIT